MSDAARVTFLRAVETAAEPTRFALLEHAATTGEFLETEATAIVGASEEQGGNIRSHAARLHRFDLLDRSGRPITYAITPLGHDVYSSISQGLRPSPPLGEDMSLVLLLLEPDL